VAEDALRFRGRNGEKLRKDPEPDCEGRCVRVPWLCELSAEITEGPESLRECDVDGRPDPCGVTTTAARLLTLPMVFKKVRNPERLRGVSSTTVADGSRLVAGLTWPSLLALVCGGCVDWICSSFTTTSKYAGASPRGSGPGPSCTRDLLSSELC